MIRAVNICLVERSMASNQILVLPTSKRVPDIKSSEAVEMFNGVIQPLDYKQEGKGFIFKDMVIRDYPLVIRINADKHKNYYQTTKKAVDYGFGNS